MFNFFLTHRREVWTLTTEHIWLVATSMTLAIAVGVPLGVWAFRRGEETTVAVNLTNDAVELDDGLRLAPWQGVVQRR